MRKMLVVLAATMLLSSATGCGVCRRMKDSLCRGSFCGLGSGALAPVRPIAVAPVVVQPTYTMAEPGCNYDPGCSYSGAETVSYPVEADCGYSGGGSYSSGSMVIPSDSGVISGGGLGLPDPAPMTTTP